MLLNYCGKLLPGDSPLFTAQSKLVKYGYGVFETIRCKASQLLRLDAHYERLESGMKLLFLDCSLIGNPER